MLNKLFSFSRPAPGPVEFLLVGLGNPGRQYEGTRHNTGFMAIDRIAEKAGARVDRIKFKGLCGEAEIDGHKTLLLKPSTFMNLSGQSVQEAMHFYKLPPEKVIILFDDISLPVGKLRIRKKGSDGGHNGMKNIIYLAGSDQFPRVKIGIGAKPNPQWDLADWVLSTFSDPEKKELQTALEHASEAVPLMIAGQTERAMNLYNA